MADVKELILRYTVDAKGATVSLDQLNKQLKEAEAETKRAGLGTQEYANGLQRVGELRTVIREVGTEFKGAGKEIFNSLGGINQNVKLNELSFGRLLQLQKELKAEVAELSLEELERGNETTRTYREVNETIAAYQRELKGAAGFQEQVAAAIRKANGPLDEQKRKQEELTGILSELKRQQADLGEKSSEEYKRIAKAVEGVEKELKDVAEAARKADAATEGIGGGLGKATQSAKLFGAAVVATGIGLFVKLIGEAIGILQTFSPVLDLVEKATSALSAAVGSVVEGFTRLVKGDFTGAFKAVTSELANNAKAAFGLRGELQALEDKQRDFAVESAEASRQIASLLIQSRNRTKTEAERIALLEKAGELERANAEKAIALAKDDLDLAERRFAADSNNDQLEQNIAAKRIALINAQAASEAVLEKIQVRKDQLAEKAAEDAQKRFEAEKKRIEAIAEANRKAEEQRRKEIEERLKLESQLFDATVNRVRQSNDVAAQFAKERADREREERQRQIAELRESEEIIASIQDESFFAQDEKEQARQLAFLESLAARNEERVRQAQFTAEQLNAIDEARAEFVQQVEQRKAEIAITASRSVLTNLAQIAGQGSAIATGALIFEKGLALSQIVIDTAEAISGLTRNSAQNPANAVTFGAAGAAQFAAGIVQILANIAQATQLVRSVVAPKPPKLRSGGILSGPSHEGGGIAMQVGGRVVAEAEGGEPILTAGVSRSPSLLAAASRINVMAGGAPLVPTSFMATGGILPQGPVFAQDDTPSLIRQLNDTLTNMPPPVLAFDEFVEFQNRVAIREAQATLGA